MWLPWYTRPWYGVGVAVALTVASAAAGTMRGFAGRVTLVTVLMLASIAQSIVPFVYIVARKLQGDRQQFSLAWLLYLMIAMQLAHAHTYWLAFILDEAGAFTNVCGLVAPTCTAADDAWRVVARLVYFSIGTFATAGLGEIAPNSLAATMLVIPEFYPIFFFTIAVGGLRPPDPRNREIR